MKFILTLTGVSVMAIGMYFMTNSVNAQNKDILFNDVEALSVCESIGWWENNGNCVKGGNVYFCKNDSWHELTDCNN